MAKVIFSPLITSARGRLGSFVAQGGPGGSMLRALSPARPRASAALQESQRTLAAASRAWNNLPVLERRTWASMARAYNPSSAGPGLAFSLGRRLFIRWASQFLHFGLPLPPIPSRWPFYDYGRWVIYWDPDSGGNFWLLFGPSGASAELRIWLQAAANWPKYSPRSPWLKAYDTLTDPHPFLYDCTWCLPPEPFAPFARFGQTSFWRARVSGILSDGRVFSLDWGEAYLAFP